MGKRGLVGTGMLVVALVLSSCKGPATATVVPQQPSAPAGPTSAPLDSGVRFALQYAPGRTQATVQQPVFTVLIENCGGQQPLTREHRESWQPAQSYVLGQSSLALDLGRYSAVIAAVVREAYQHETDPGRRLDAMLSLGADPDSRSEYDLRWEEQWEDNVLLVSSDGQETGSVPIRVLVAARLVTVSTRRSACTRRTVSAVPTGGSKPQASPTRPVGRPSVTPSLAPTYPRAGSAEAVELVEEFLDLLSRGSPRTAYGLLTESYRARMSFSAFQANYQEVKGIEVHSLEATQVAKDTERVVAGLTLAIETGGDLTFADYWGAFEITAARGRSRYQRLINSVALERIPPQ